MTTRKEFIQAAKAQLDRWDAQIEELEARWKKAEADAEMEYEDQLKKIRSKRGEAKEQIDKVQKSSDNAWDDVRLGSEKAWKEIQEAIQKAATRF